MAGSVGDERQLTVIVIRKTGSRAPISTEGSRPDLNPPVEARVEASEGGRSQRCG
jgi:hypothetical protein